MEISQETSNLNSPKYINHNSDNSNNINSPISSQISMQYKNDGKEDTINQTKIDTKKVLDNPENRKLSIKNKLII